MSEETIVLVIVYSFVFGFFTACWWVMSSNDRLNRVRRELGAPPRDEDGNILSQ